MMGRTHLVVGMVGAFDLALMTHTPISLLGLAVAGTTSLLPDLDEEHSMLGRRLGGKVGAGLIGAAITAGAVYLRSWPTVPVGLAIAGIPHLRHRGLTHSLLAVGLLAIYLHWLSATIHDPSVLLMGVAGYGLHLLADFTTNRGIPALEPITSRRFGFRLMDTGSPFESLASMVPIMVGLWYGLSHHVF